MSLAFIIQRVAGTRYNKAIKTDTKLYKLLLTRKICPFDFVHHA